MVLGRLYLTVVCVRVGNKGLSFSWKTDFADKPIFFCMYVSGIHPYSRVTTICDVAFSPGKCRCRTRIINVSQITHLYVQKLPYSARILGHFCLGSHAVTSNNISKHVCESSSIEFRRGILSIQILRTMGNPQHVGI